MLTILYIFLMWERQFHSFNCLIWIHDNKLTARTAVGLYKPLGLAWNSSASYLYDGTVVSRGFYLGSDDVRRPVRQPVVDSDHEGVFEELREEEQGEQEDAGGGQVGTTGTPGDGGSLTQHLRQVVLIVTFHRLLWDQHTYEVKQRCSLMRNYTSCLFDWQTATTRREKPSKGPENGEKTKSKLQTTESLIYTSKQMLILVRS